MFWKNSKSVRSSSCRQSTSGLISSISLVMILAKLLVADEGIEVRLAMVWEVMLHDVAFLEKVVAHDAQGRHRELVSQAQPYALDFGSLAVAQDYSLEIQRMLLDSLHLLQPKCPGISSQGSLILKDMVDLTD